MADDFRLVPMPNGGFQKVASLEARFWGKVDKRGDDECWLWAASVSQKGYGIVRDGRSMRLAHQIALELSGRARPSAPNNHALHGPCNNRLCCNPAHLRWGSNDDNVQDRKRYGAPYFGSKLKGEGHGASKLTERAVLEIRSAQGKQSDIARKFGVCQMTVSHIKRRLTWRHI